MSVRVYVPVSSEGLGRLVSERRLDGPLPAHAVTAELREAWPEADQEEWEYAALMAAAVSSRAGAGPSGRRRVVAADVPATAPGAGDDPTGVVLPGGVSWPQVAAALVDLADDADDDADLAWFATQEIAALV